MEPRKVTPLLKTPVNRLFFAINHFVSTGNHIGEGIALPVGSKIRMLIPVNTVMTQDLQDFAAFRSRFLELAPRFALTLTGPENNGLFDIYYFDIEPGRMDELAQELRKKPGPKGWGSSKKVIDQYKWDE